ncbi:peptide/nickel transport system permease protein [Alteribacillus iranensis]|uniref:Peptide/nickel transport system permease protein n=1 Tax=Alteribacillus iranensis TaxID=930128 RepID=A0A1I2BDV4_9BACI|nr:peptide/nickel transport system permease protein [Alteribacillus iranensis]
MRPQKLASYFISKLLRLVLLLFAVSLASFILISFSPVDPVQSYIGAEASRVSPEQRKEIEAYWGLNEPLIDQYKKWVTAILQGDLGTSLLFRAPVSHVIGERFVASFLLMAIAWILSGVIGLILGILTGSKHGSWLDRSIRLYCYILSSTPSFWLGLLLLMTFSVWLGWSPVGLASPAGILTDEVTIWQKLNHLILPALTLSLLGVAQTTLHTRQKLIEVLASEYAIYAKAKGESDLQLLWRHGLRNAALPAISIQFATFGELFGGAVLAEQVFSYPGLGQAVVQAGLGGDIPLLLGIVLFSTIFVFTGNSLADIIYRLIDPRLRNGGRQ